MTEHRCAQAAHGKMKNNNHSEERPSCMTAPDWRELHARVPQEALDELERELNVRARCFDRWVGEGRMSMTDARDRIERMATAHKLLLGYVTEQLKTAAGT